MKIRLSLVLVALAALASTSAHAGGTASAQYVVTGGVFQASHNAAPVGFGGYSFGGRSTAPVSVKVVDSSGPKVGAFVCQDTNANLICGEAGEPQKAFCSSATAVPLTGFDPGKSTTVFVSGVDVDCEGVGTVGVVTLTFA